MYSIRELKKIKSFINKNMSYFSSIDLVKDNFKQIDSIISGKRENDYELPYTLQEILFQAFFECDLITINPLTPSFIKNDIYSSDDLNAGL